MAMRDEDFAATLTPVEDDDGLWSPCMAAPVCKPPDWQSLCDQAEACAESGAGAAEARAEALLVVARRGAAQPQPESLPDFLSALGC